MRNIINGEENIFENMESVDKTFELSKELDIIDYHIRNCLDILSEDAYDNNSKGYSSYNIANQKTPMHSFLLTAKRKKLNNIPHDPQESMYYMASIVDNLIEAYKKYLHTN